METSQASLFVERERETKMDKIVDALGKLGEQMGLATLTAQG